MRGGADATYFWGEGGSGFLGGHTVRTKALWFDVQYRVGGCLVRGRFSYLVGKKQPQGDEVDDLCRDQEAGLDAGMAKGNKVAVVRGIETRDRRNAGGVKKEGG